MDPVIKGREVLRLTDEIDRRIARKKVIQTEIDSIDIEIHFLNQQIRDMAEGKQGSWAKTITERIINKSKRL